MSDSPKKQIRDFLIVIGGGILAGVLVVLALINIYGPSQTFLAGNVLLSPEVLNTPSFGFEEVEFLYFDAPSTQWKSKKIPISVYGSFYELVRKDESVTDSFDDSPPARILIKAQKEIFQQVEFAADGKHYRAQLKDAEAGKEWALFSHEGVLQKLKSLFGEK